MECGGRYSPGAGNWYFLRAVFNVFLIIKVSSVFIENLFLNIELSTFELKLLTVELLVRKEKERIS